MKKKRIIVLIFIIMFFFMTNVSANTACYKRCVNPIQNDCSFVSKCKAGGSISCQKVEAEFCKETSNNNSGKVKASCGSGTGKVTGIPVKIPELTSYMIRLIQVAVPVILVIMGLLDLFKGMSSQKEDEIKKGQQMFIKRLAVAAIIFLIVIVIKFFISIVADTNVSNTIACIDCFISNKCDKYNDTSKKDSSSTSTNTQSTNNQSTNNQSTNNQSTNNQSTNNQSTNNQSKNETNSTSKPKISSNLFVGDSRTYGMCESYKLCEGYPYIAKVGMGYSWFVNTAIPQINTKIKSKNYNIVILMGVNGVTKVGKSEADKYYNKISDLAKTTWKNQNILFVSINPVVDGKSNAYMSGVNEFNKQMKSKINSSKISNLSYCDTISYLNMSEIDNGDGLHYNKSGYQQIYNLIKKNCLKQK